MLAVARESLMMTKLLLQPMTVEGKKVSTVSTVTQVRKLQRCVSGTGGCGGPTTPQKLKTIVFKHKQFKYKFVKRGMCILCVAHEGEDGGLEGAYHAQPLPAVVQHAVPARDIGHQLA